MSFTKFITAVYFILSYSRIYLHFEFNEITCLNTGDFQLLLMQVVPNKLRYREF